MENREILKSIAERPHHGTLDFYYGTMETGKTTALLMKEFDANKAGLNTLVIKPKTDTKGGNSVVSRLGVSRATDFTFSSDESIFEKVEEYLLEHPVDVIFVDEAQFITPKQVLELRDLVYYENLRIYCYSLRVDFQGQVFPGSLALWEIANNRIELNGSCTFCGDKATHNLRYQLERSEELKEIKEKSFGWKETVLKYIVFEGEQVVIDNQDLSGYIPVCFHCNNTIYYDRYPKKIKYRS